MTKAEIAASKLHIAMRKVSDRNVALIIGALLRRYERYGLADIVETCWNWKSDGWKPPKEIQKGSES